MTTKEFSELGTTQQMCLVTAPVRSHTLFFVERLKVTMQTGNLACMAFMPLDLSTVLMKLLKWQSN